MSGFDVGLFAAAAEVERILEELAYPFCLIGGVANARWGNPRATRDIDVAVLTGWGHEDEDISRLLTRFVPRFDDAAELAREARVLLVQTSSGVEVDLSLAALPFEERACQRASMWEPQKGILLKTASAEDLIVMKSFAGRPQDWLDVREIIVRQSEHLDWQRLTDELGAFAGLNDDVDLVETVQRIRREVEESDRS
jgi:hypothetical protein